MPKWIELDTRPQFSFDTEYQELSKTIEQIIEKISNLTKKPIIEVKIQGEEIETDQIQAQIARLNTLSLRCFWKITTKQTSDSSVFLDRPSAIEDEMLRLSTSVLDSKKDADFAIKELLPTLTADGINEALEIILHDYEKYKKEEKQ